MNKRTWVLIGIFGGLFLVMGAFSAGAIVGNFFIPQPDLDWLNLTTDPYPSSTDGDPAADLASELTTEELFSPFWEAWDIVHDQFIDQPVNDQDMMRGAITGMLESLRDAHTGYMDPNQFMQANIPMDGEYEGIGAWVDTSTEYLTIISPMPGSPAEEAGLLSGDEVIEIDGEDMTDLDGSLVIRKVLGPAGSTVVLTIRREGEPTTFDVTIIRAKITIASVESSMLDDGIGYVQVLTFAQETQSELQNNLEEIMAENPVGLIIDLRNNGGG